MSVLLSIVIPSWNSNDNIRCCLKSIIEQNIPEDKYEVIVVNDGSTDDTLSICEQTAKDRNNYKVFSIVHSGRSSAINYGMERAAGQWAMLLWDCDRLVPNSLNHILSKVDALPLVDIIRYDGNVNFMGTSHDYIHEYGLPFTSRGFMFHINYLNKHKIFFHDYVVYDDLLFVSHALLCNCNMTSIQADVYRKGQDVYDLTKNQDPVLMQRIIMDGLKANYHLFSYVERYNLSSNVVCYNRCIDLVNKIKVPLINQMILTKYSYKEYKHEMHKCWGQDFFPVYRWERTPRCRKIVDRINQISKSYFFYKISSFLKIQFPF